MVVVAGCSLPPGVAVTVKTDKATTMVEMFVGNDPAGDCDDDGGNCQIGPPPPMGSTLGRFYVGAGWTSRATAVDRALVKGGVARFQIQVDDSAGGDQFVPSVILVGYDAAGAPTSVAVMHDLDVFAGTSVEVRTTLAPAMPITAPASSGERVEVWRQPTDTDASLAACVVVGHADGTTEFVTPAGDTDCDGARPMAMAINKPMAECSASSEWNYCGEYGARLGEVTCVKTTATRGCRLAGPPCYDGGPPCRTPPSSCELAGEIACIPSEVCTQISASCMTWSDNCLSNAFATSTLPSVHCSFVFDQLGMPCGGWPQLAIDDSTADTILGGRQCTNTALAAITQPIQIGSSVGLSGGGTLSLVPNGEPCSPEVHLVGAATLDTKTLLDIVSDPAPYQHRMVFMNISSTTTGSCVGSISTCSIYQPSGYNYICP
jgi:hypothetical protein